jgi:hypothetical protein
MALKLGCVPFAPHLFFTQFLNDKNPNDRALGIDSGKAFMKVCDRVWVFDQNGISKGMEHEIEYAKSIKKPIVIVGLEGI